MVSDTSESYSRQAAARATALDRSGAAVRESRLEGLGICTLVVGSVAVVVFFMPDLNRLAWMPGLVAMGLGALDLQLKVSRRRYAILGMMLGVSAFSWSFAMVLFGSAR